KRWHIDLYNLYQKKEISLEEAINIASNRLKSHSDNSDSNKSQEVANIADNVNDSVNVNDTVNDTVTVNDINNNLFVADAPKKDSSEEFLKAEGDGKEKISAKKEKDFGKPEFRQALIDLGSDPLHVEDWIKVRVAKRATFTHTALQAFFNECNKHNFPIPEAVRICAEKSWQGFKYEWVLNDQNNNYGKTTITTNQSRQQRADDVAKVRDLAKKIILSSSEQSNGCP